MLHAQPGQFLRCIDQRPVQRTALQPINHLGHAIPLHLAVLARLIQHIEIAHKQQPAYSRMRKPRHQRLAQACLPRQVTRRQRW
ncbi:hypothetical protein D9M68_958930 [compost metagenome]